MDTKWKKKLISCITALFMLLSVFGVPALGYTAENEQGFVIYSYDNKTGSMSELTGEWHAYLQASQYAGAPWAYFHVRPADEEAAQEYTVEWKSSNPKVAECIETGSSDIIQVMYHAGGTATISAVVNGKVADSFKIKITDEEAERIPIANIGFYIDGEAGDGIIDAWAWDGEYYADYLLPFEYDRDKGVFVIVNSIDGYETKYTAKAVNGRAEIKYAAEVNGVKQNFTIYFRERTASPDVNCSIYILAKNSGGDEKRIDIECEEAKNETAKIIIPYGYNEDIRLFVTPNYSGAKIDNYDGYLGPYGEFIGESVSIGQVKTFTVVAADGTKQDYSLEFLMLDGKSVDINLELFCDDPNTKDFAENGWSMKWPKFVEANGVRVASVKLPYKYDNKKGFQIQYSLNDTACCDLQNGKYYLDADGTKKIEFTVTSGDGLLSQKYVLNVSKEDKGTSTALEYLRICYTDKNGNRVSKDLSITKAATKEGVFYRLPAGTKLNISYGVSIEAKAVENAYVVKCDIASAEDETYWYLETVRSRFNLGDGEECPKGGKLTFTVRSSNGKNKKTYIIKTDKHEHKYKKTIVKPTYTEKGYTKKACACGYVKKSNYTAKKVYKAVPKNVYANLSTEIDGYDNVKLSWSKVSGATGYKLYYKKGSAKKWSGLATVKGKTSFVTEDLADGAKYTFKVVPYIKKNDKVANSTKYKTASVYTLKKLSAPKIVKSGKKVKVSWTNINGETGYQISQSTEETVINVVGTYKTTKDKSRTIKAAKDTKYYYAVRPYKNVKVGNKTVKVFGPWSNEKAYTRK